MANEPRGRRSTRKSSTKSKQIAETVERDVNLAEESAELQDTEDPSLAKRLLDLTGGLTVSAFRLAVQTSGVPWKIAKAVLLKPEQLGSLEPGQLRLMQETGLYLRDLRGVAGLTLSELSDAIDLEDHSLLEAVEGGTAALSFELILRLAALLARHDPIPFIIRVTRSYNPELWQVLEDWGIGRLPLQFERERQFVNIYRRHDAARNLSDAGFQEVLKFTQAAFELSLRFVAEQEEIADRTLDVS